MSEITDGLMLHDIVLIILGALMFLILLGGLGVKIVKSEEVSKLYLLGFLIPILMIGFPSIQRLSFSRDLIELEKLAKEVSENPENTLARAQLDEKIESVGPRAKSVESKQKVAESYLAGDQPEKARETAKEVLEQDPDNLTAKGIVSVVEAETEFRHLESKTEGVSPEELEKAKQNIEKASESAIQTRNPILDRKVANLKNQWVESKKLIPAPGPAIDTLREISPDR